MRDNNNKLSEKEEKKIINNIRSEQYQDVQEHEFPRPMHGPQIFIRGTCIHNQDGQVIGTLMPVRRRKMKK
jgi:hypothetical protein